MGIWIVMIGEVPHPSCTVNYSPSLAAQLLLAYRHRINHFKNLARAGGLIAPDLFLHRHPDQSARQADRRFHKRLFAEISNRSDSASAPLTLCLIVIVFRATPASGSWSASSRSSPE